MKDLKDYLKGLVLFTLSIIILILTSCTKDEGGAFSPCIAGDCIVTAYPDPVSQPNAYLDENGYYHLAYEGATYFSLVIKYGLTKEMTAANQPSIETEYTTDTWLINQGGYKMWSSRYNPLGSDYTQGFQTAIADTMIVVSIPRSEVKEMMNMSGQYYRDCYNFGCGLGNKPTVRPGMTHKAKALFTYFPEQAQVHDTVTIFLESNYYEREARDDIRVEVNTEVKVIL